MGNEPPFFGQPKVIYCKKFRSWVPWLGRTGGWIGGCRSVACFLATVNTSDKNLTLSKLERLTPTAAVKFLGHAANCNRPASTTSLLSPK